MVLRSLVGLLLVVGICQSATAEFKVYFPTTHWEEANSTDDEPRSNFKGEDWCSTNGSYCHNYGANCECEQESGEYHCICPSALDYTLRLAAGIAIILLVGVSIMLAFSLYRRAMLMRRRNGRRVSANSDASSVEGGGVGADPPPLYAEINVISSPSLDAADFEKLPTYDEALEFLKNVHATSNNSSSTTNTTTTTTTIVMSSEAKSSEPPAYAAAPPPASPPQQQQQQTTTTTSVTVSLQQTT